MVPRRGKTATEEYNNRREPHRYQQRHLAPFLPTTKHPSLVVVVVVIVVIVVLVFLRNGTSMSAHKPILVTTLRSKIIPQEVK